jgi:hypothetical protein
VNLLRRRTLPNDDTGIVVVTVRRDLYKTGQKTPGFQTWG